MPRVPPPPLFPTVCLALVAALGTITGGCLSLGDPTSERDVSGEMMFDGLVRTYRLHVPEGYDPVAATPLLFAFHGVPGTGEDMQAISGFDAVADALRFLVAYPDATSDWAEGCDGCARADGEGVNDVASPWPSSIALLRDGM
ncbi:MAG: hypothetical protein GTN62_03090 [Gemmatimonadales bacterium]|nr:hypothetical protein [Gemmatimonadales bacterium]NIN49085.1 hypothetical protein [Gemmatimonadales bacterium]NIP06549.1 hypothetical protein [Gemmatimonadales bacterium]NIR00246.1 hypothetical protein [Gemmatimonadales bacterium]NIS64579.1 hypothetical protein [Gemmatimonadales bacterium]